MFKEIARSRDDNKDIAVSGDALAQEDPLVHISRLIGYIESCNDIISLRIFDNIVEDDNK